MTEPVKFKDMPYERPDLETVKAEYARLAQALADAATLEAADAAFLEKDRLDRHTQTAAELAMIRHVIDTRDEFYDAEASFWDEVLALPPPAGGEVRHAALCPGRAGAPHHRPGDRGGHEARERPRAGVREAHRLRADSL